MTVLHLVAPDTVDDPQRPSGGNVYDVRVCDALTELGRSVRLHRVAGPWPSAGGHAAVALGQALAAIPDGGVVLVDGLVGNGLPEVLLREAARLTLVALVHMPLGSVEGGKDAEGEAARERERAALSACAAVVTTSAWSRRWLLDAYALAPGRLHVAEPGVDQHPPVVGTSSGRHLLCVAAVTPIKGHDLLVTALASVDDLAWTCTCVGSTALDPTFAARVSRSLAGHGIADRVRFTGPLSGRALHSAYAGADLLVLASRAETYGMVVSEALAHALPVIATNVGGVSEALGGRGGEHPGVLVPPTDPDALARALRRWLTDPEWRARLRRQVLARRQELSGWSVTAERVSHVVAGLTGVPAAG